LNFSSPKIRLRLRFFRFGWLGFLAAALLLPLSRAAAQTPATQPAPLTAQGSGPEPGKAPAGMPGEQGNSEEKQIDGFLHAPAVKTLARFLHLSLDATDNIFLGLNYAIIFLVILVPLARFMPKVLRKRNQTLRHNLESARKLTEEARARLNAVEAQLARLGDEIDKFRSEVEAELKSDEARIKGTIEEESSRIIAAAEQEIGLAAVQARRELRKFAAELAVEHAARQMALSPETDRALVAEFAESITGHKNGGAGGRD
jgi:F-type H+-transporting ATPase subunit b